jgi:hypothetical protein
VPLYVPLVRMPGTAMPTLGVVSVDPVSLDLGMDGRVAGKRKEGGEARELYSFR